MTRFPIIAALTFLLTALIAATVSERSSAPGISVRKVRLPFAVNRQM
jgi:hypothetical protein